MDKVSLRMSDFSQIIAGVRLKVASPCNSVFTVIRDSHIFTLTLNFLRFQWLMGLEVLSLEKHIILERYFYVIIFVYLNSINIPLQP